MRSPSDPAQIRAFFAGVGCTCVLVALVVVVARWGEPIRDAVPQYVISQPMIVATERHLGVLPAGSVLRFREAIPEGGSYYEVVVRSYLDIEATELDDRSVIAPIEAASTWRRRLMPDDLLAFLRQLNVTQEDVAAVAPRFDTDPVRVEPARPPARPVALETPLVVQGDEGIGALPPGTVLRLRDEREDGSDDYEVVVRVDRTVPRSAQEEWMIGEPIRSSRPSTDLRGDALRDFLRTMNVARSDLEQALAGMPK